MTREATKKILSGVLVDLSLSIVEAVIVIMAGNIITVVLPIYMYT